MKFPSLPIKGGAVETTVTEIINHLRASKITGMTGGRVKETPNGTTIEVIFPKSVKQETASSVIPFKLSVLLVDDVWKWKVSSKYSSVTLGFDGPAVDLGPSGAAWASGAIKFDVETEITETSYILLQTEIDSLLGSSNYTLIAVTDEEDATHVVYDESAPYGQAYAQLLIGKITFDEETPPAATATQSVYSPQVLGFTLVNTIPVRRFGCHGINLTNL